MATATVHMDSIASKKPTGINRTPDPSHSPHHMNNPNMHPSRQASKISPFIINSRNKSYPTKAPMNPEKITHRHRSHKHLCLKPALNYHQLATLNSWVINQGYRTFKEYTKSVQTIQAEVDSNDQPTPQMMFLSNINSRHQAHQAHLIPMASTQTPDPSIKSYHQNPLDMNSGDQSQKSDQTLHPQTGTNKIHEYWLTQDALNPQKVVQLPQTACNDNSGFQKPAAVDPVAQTSCASGLHGLQKQDSNFVKNSKAARSKRLQDDEAGFLLSEVKVSQPQGRIKCPSGEKPSPTPQVKIPGSTYTPTAACEVPIKKFKDDFAPNGLFDRIFGLHWNLKEWPFVSEIPVDNDLPVIAAQLNGQKRKISQVDQVDENSNAKRFKLDEQDVFDWRDIDAFMQWATENPDACDLTSTQDASEWIAEFCSPGVVTLQQVQSNTEPTAPGNNISPVTLVALQKQRLSHVDAIEENLNSKKVKQKQDPRDDAFDWDVIDELMEVISQNNITIPAANVQEFAAWGAPSSPPAPAAQTPPSASQAVTPTAQIFHPIIGFNTNFGPQEKSGPKKMGSFAITSIAPQKRRLSQVTHVEPQNSTAKKVKQKEDSTDDIFDWSIIDELIEDIDQGKVTFPKAAVDEFAQWAAQVSSPAPQTVQPVVWTNTTNVAPMIHITPVAPISSIADVCSTPQIIQPVFEPKINHQVAPKNVFSVKNVAPHKRRISQVTEVEPQNFTAKKVKQKEDPKEDVFDWSAIDEFIEAIDQGKITFPKAAVEEFAQWAAQTKFAGCSC